MNDYRFNVIYYLNNKKLSRTDLFDCCLYNIKDSYYPYCKKKNNKDIIIFLIKIYSIKSFEITNYNNNPILKDIFLKNQKKKDYVQKLSNILKYFKNKKTKTIIVNNYSCLLKGRRHYMEDRVVLKNNVLFNFSCILDGHGGYECSDFLKKHIYSTFTNNLRQKYEIKESIIKTFEILNKSFLKCNYNSGSTCNLLIINRNINKYYLSNVGDSRCLAIYKNNKFKQISIDHRPENLKEKIRIELLGGSILKKRVNGILGLTRAFGDKEISFLVKPDPDIYEGKINNIKYFLQATDGLFDFASNKEIIIFFNKCLEENNNNYEISLQMLLKYIYKVKRSKDNISIIITTIH